MKFAITFATGCPLGKSTVFVDAQNENNARLYARTMFGHIWAGIYEIESFKSEYYDNVINATTTAEEGLRRAHQNGWIHQEDVPMSVWEHEGED